MDDYAKVTYGMRNTLQLIRKDDNDALFRTAAAAVGKVVLSKLTWVVPIVQPNDVLKVNMYKSIAVNSTIPGGFRRRQCETFTFQSYPPFCLHKRTIEGLILLFF